MRVGDNVVVVVVCLLSTSTTQQEERGGFRDGRKGGMLDILINQRARPASASATLQAKPELLDNITSLTATSHSALDCSSVLRPTRFAACSCATGANHTE